MIPSREYSDRIEQIEEFYEFLCFITSIETYKENSKIKYSTKSFPITLEFTKNLKAQFVLMLYNLLEDTVRSLISNIFDTISDENITFKDLTLPLKEAFLDQELKTDTQIKKIREYFLEFAEENCNKCILFNIQEVEISGNLDMKQVKRLSKRYGLPNSKLYTNKEIAESLLVIKNTRNQLAHGDVSFCNKGGMFTMSDILKMKTNTIKFLDELIRIQKNYIDKKMYLDK